MPLTARTAELLDRLAVSGIRLGTATTRTLLHALGDPQRRVPAVLVAGTNGKGSTAALLAAIAGAAGYRTGLFTSPPLEDFAEQVRVDGRAIDAAALEAAFERVMAAAESALPEAPTAFEALTAAALLYFAGSDCDLAILEAGMGGGRDATNAGEPILSLITSVAFDHREYLGSTLAEIAAEKAGIFRPGRPALAGALPPEALEAVEAAARRQGTDLHLLSEEAPEVGAPEGQSWAGQRVAFTTPLRRYDLDLQLLGAHQAGNLRLAVRAAEILGAAGWSGFEAEAIGRGVAACRWPGRLEYVALGKGRGVLFDAGHNPHGIAALLDFLQETRQPFDLLFGVLEDKDAGEMLPPLARQAGRMVLTNPGGPRGRDPLELLAHTGGTPTVLHSDLDAALEEALRPAPPLLVVCGSLRLAGAMRRRLREKLGVPPPALDLPAC